MSQAEIAKTIPYVDLHMDLSTYARGVFGENPLVERDPTAPAPSVRGFDGTAFRYLPNLDVPRMLRSGITIVTLNGCPYPYDPNKNDLVAPNNLWKEFRMHALVAEQTQAAHPDRMQIVKTREELAEAQGLGRIAIVHSIEGLHLPKDSNKAMKVVEDLWGYGVRNFGFTWNFPTEVGMTGHADFVKSEADDTGITDLGKDVVNFLNGKGGIIDISHASDRTSRDILGLATKAKVIASHAGVRAMTKHNRNLPDDVAKELFIHGFPLVWTFAKQNADDTSRSPDRVARHMAYAANTIHQGDVSKLALGPDFGGTLYTSRIYGVEDVANFRGALYVAMRGVGFTHDQIVQIFHKNGENHYQQNLPSRVIA